MRIEKPSDRIGERLSFYRRLSGLSAAELSDLTNGAISKGVIANIETGRKRDLTVDELISLSWALQIPPVALALPIESPEAMVKVASEGDGTYAVKVAVVARLFVEPAVPWKAKFAYAEGGDTPAGALARSRVSSLFQWWSALEEKWAFKHKRRLAKQENKEEEVERYSELIREAEIDIERREQQMRSFGMNQNDDG